MLAAPAREPVTHFESALGSARCAAPSEASVAASGLPLSSQDIGYSPGLLHHLPNITTSISDRNFFRLVCFLAVVTRNTKVKLFATHYPSPRLLS